MLDNTINSFTQNDYEIIKREVLYEGYLMAAGAILLHAN